MSGIYLAEKIRSPAGKHRGIEVHEVLFGRQSLQGLLQRRFEEVCEPEEMASLGYIHCPELSGPLVYVLENVPMNRFEMRDVESPRNGSIDQLSNATVGSTCFKAFQQFRVSETAQIFEDVCAGIEIRVRIPGYRAHRSRSLLQQALTLHQCIAGIKPLLCRRAPSPLVSRKQEPLRRRVFAGRAQWP